MWYSSFWVPPSLSSPHQLLDIRHFILNYPLYFLFPPPFCSVLDLLTGEMRAKFLSLPQSLISTSSFSRCERQKEREREQRCKDD